MDHNDEDGPLLLDALDGLLGHDGPVAEAAGGVGLDAVDPLDVGALQLLGAAPRPHKHSAEHMANMRARLSKRRCDEARLSVAVAKDEHRTKLKAVAMLAPAAARAAGLPVHHRFKAGDTIDESTACNILRIAFMGHNRFATPSCTPTDQ
jgi:hypothetical protein